MKDRTRHLTHAIVNLEHVSHNLQILQTLVGKRPLWPAIKADAYAALSDLTTETFTR